MMVTASILAEGGRRKRPTKPQRHCRRRIQIAAKTAKVVQFHNKWGETRGQANAGCRPVNNSFPGLASRRLCLGATTHETANAYENWEPIGTNARLKDMDDQRD